TCEPSRKRKSAASARPPRAGRTKSSSIGSTRTTSTSALHATPSPVIGPPVAPAAQARPAMADAVAALALPPPLLRFRQERLPRQPRLARPVRAALLPPVTTPPRQP